MPLEEGNSGGWVVSKNPAFQFYPGDYLSSQRVSLMTLEEEGAYIRLLCYCWKHGHIPSDPIQLAHLIGKGATVKLAPKVSKMVLAKGGSRLVHDKLEELREERNRWIEKSRQGGLKTAEKRRKLKESAKQSNHPTHHPTKGGTEMVDDCLADWLPPKGYTSTSSSNIHTHTSEHPSKEEVLTYAEMVGLVAWRAEDWWLDMESKGWRSANTEIVNWQAAMCRIKKYWEGDGRPMERPSRNSTNSSTNNQMPRWKRIEVLKEQLQVHPGNAESTFFRQGDAKARNEYKALKAKLRELNEEERQVALG